MDSVVSPATAIAIGRARRARGAQPRGAVDPLRGPRAAARRDRRASTTPRSRGGCRRSTTRPIRPELVAARIAEVRAAGVTVAAALSPQRTAQLWKTVVDAGVDLFVIRGTTVSRRARVRPGRAAEPQAVHLRARRAGHRRRVRDLPGGAAPHAHRRGRRARRLRRRRVAHHPVGARRRGADGLRRRRRARGPARLPRRVGRPLRARHRRRRSRALRRRVEGDRLRRRRGDGRARRWPGPPRRRAAASTGAPRRTTASCRAASGCGSARSARWRRSCSARRGSPTAR